MSPEAKQALLRNILMATETKAAAVLKAEQDYSAALRQLIDGVLANGNGAVAIKEEAP